MQGLHLTADLYDCLCAPWRFTDATRLGDAVVQAVEAAGLTAVGRLCHTFPPSPGGPGGVTAAVLLAESHVCVHTWPELRAVTLDVYVCNLNTDNRPQARDVLSRLEALFNPQRTSHQALTRGGPMANLPTPEAEPRSTPAIILAAGRGERMRPLTDATPKPLLCVQGQPLLAWHVHALVAGGFTQLVFNTAWLAEKITSFFHASRFDDGVFKLFISNQTKPNVVPSARPCNLHSTAGASVFSARFSNEQADFGSALETAGGIARALPLLGTHQRPGAQDVFWVVAGDVFVPGFVFSQTSVDRFRASTHLAHLWLVPNPPHNPQGDFGLSQAGLALNLPKPDSQPGSAPTAPAQTPRYTYSTIGLYRAELFGPPWCDMPHGNPTGIKAPLAPLLRRAMDAGRVSAELYTGPWTDVGTPERLAELNAT